ncbi:Nucleoside Diphosphate Kinase 6 [Manis pentadactyla]|nr:Nucleoside Diphosphate Kinase 6 [Manis pentadactyla]
MLMVAETLALRKELGSGSDVTGVQDVGSGLWRMCDSVYDYSEAIVVSMVILEFQATGPLALGLCNHKRY